MSEGWRVLALSSGVEFFGVWCHVVNMKFGGIFCVPDVGGLFVLTCAMGRKVSLNCGMMFLWEIRYVTLYLVCSGPHLGKTQPQEHTFIINTCVCVSHYFI
jgi:hypothetical protein